MVLSGADSLVVLNREVLMADQVAERGCLPVGKGVLPHHDVPEDRTLSSNVDLIELGGEPFREELEPTRGVHAVLADPLERRIAGGQVPVVFLADGD